MRLSRGRPRSWITGSAAIAATLVLLSGCGGSSSSSSSSSAPASSSSTSQTSETVRAPVSSRRPSCPYSTSSRAHRRRRGLRFSRRVPRPMRRWRRRSSSWRQSGRPRLPSSRRCSLRRSSPLPTTDLKSQVSRGQGGPRGDRLGSAESQRHRGQGRHDQARQRHREREGDEYDTQQRDFVGATTFVRDPHEYCMPTGYATGRVPLRRTGSRRPSITPARDSKREAGRATRPHAARDGAG